MDSRAVRMTRRFSLLWIPAVILLAASAWLLLPRPRGRVPHTVLTPEERAWLDANRDNITLYYNTDFPPIEFASPDGSGFTGLGADVVSAVERRLGVTFRKIPCNDWNRHLEALARGECAIAPTIVRTPERESYAFFTEPYASVPVVIITDRAHREDLTLDLLDGFRVAVVSGFATEGYVRERNRGRFQVVPVHNVPDGLRAVSFGEVDALVENLAVAAYYTDLEGLSNLRVAGTTEFFFDWSIGVSARYPLLFSAVRKALRDIPQSELEAAQKKWISMETHRGFSPETRRILGFSALAVTLMLAGLAAVAVFLRRRLNEKVRSLQKAQQEILEQSRLLQHAEKMEALGTLAGGVAHDFNNLLQVIGGYTQLLLARRDTDDQDRKELSQILGASRRAAALVNQLLTFGRKVDSRKVPLDLNSEVQKAVDILRQTIPRMIDIRLDLDPELPRVSADPLQMEQILLNLAGNSVDAMPEGGELYFGTCQVPPDSRELPEGLRHRAFVRLSVRDTGCGMDSETMNCIFDPFFTTKEQGRGTGLGLASVYGIVQSHQGFVRCASAPDEGTLFTVFLPAVSGEPDEFPGGGSKTPGIVRGAGTVLVVEDEPEILKQTGEYLRSLGYEVLAASSGEEALEIHCSRPAIDLVLLDLNMPGMGGRRCLRELLGRDPRLRVVIVSGHSAIGGETLPGARSFLAKPYRLGELAEGVRKALEDEA
jgi:signal transduction histidine kinase